MKKLLVLCVHMTTKIVSEYDQEIPQSQTADNPVTPRPLLNESAEGRRMIVKISS